MRSTIAGKIKLRAMKALAPSPVIDSPRASRPAGPGAAVFALYLIVQIVQLRVLLSLAPRFFWLDDSQRQFGPMAWWLGRNLQNGRPALMDPDLGMSGNIVSDMQYGALDPLHWLFQYLVAKSDDFLVISSMYASVSVLLLGTGVVWLLRHYGVRPAFAIAGALGVATSGFLMWFGGNWWPVMWSTPWLPLLWVGLATRRWPGVIVSGVATWAILASGNPYAVPFALLIVGAQIWERRRELGSFRALLQPWILARLAACAGGVIVALPTLLSAVQIAELMSREPADKFLGNTGFGVTNLADVIASAMTLLGQTNAWSGSIGRGPVTATMVLALPLLALVTWKKAIQSPGVPTGLVLVVCSAAATQLPTVVGVFRNPNRHMVIFQISLPLLALIALTAAPNLSKTRIKVAGALVLFQFALSVSRAPVFLGWHLLALGISAVAGYAVFTLLKDRTGGAVLMSTLFIAGVAAGPLVGEQMMVALSRHEQELFSLPPTADQPFRELPTGYGLGTTVEEYRARSYAVDETLTVMRWGNCCHDEGWSTGIMTGNANLIVGLKTGFGSLAVGQAKLQKHWCRDYVGQTCATNEQLLGKVKGTDRPWVDVLSGDIVVMHASAPVEVRAYFDAGWDRGLESDLWVEYTRRAPLPGRVAVADRVTVDPEEFKAGAAYIGRPMESYLLSTGPGGGSLIFRTPFWPGFKAKLDGKSVPVSSVDQTVLKVDLPAGLSRAKLEIFYEPVGAAISTPATLLGLIVIAVSALALVALDRRNGRLPVPDDAGPPGPTRPERE